MVTFSTGSKKKVYRSLREAAKATGIPYMTLYMRLRHGWKPSKAAKAKVRPYRSWGSKRNEQFKAA